MNLPFQTFQTTVGNAAAAVQGAASQLLDLTVGSTLRAMLEAHAGIALWLQWLIGLLLQTTRAATSAGPDLDSWVADFSLTRLPASTAAGRVQLSRFVAVTPALIPVGLPVRTTDGAETFAVVAEPGNPLWQATTNGFAVPIGTVTADVPVVAVIAGTASNVQVNTVTLVASALPGIDTVTNAAPMSGGLDAESDIALRARFQLFLASLSRATVTAIEAAVLGTRQGLTVAVTENTLPNGATQNGFFTVIVDNGTGSPPASVLQAAAAAVENVRPIGSAYVVQPPSILQVAVELIITTQSSASHATAAVNVAAAITAFVDTLPVGASLPNSRIVQVAFDADPSVRNVASVTLNGATTDVVPGPSTVVKLSSVTVI